MHSVYANTQSAMVGNVRVVCDMRDLFKTRLFSDRSVMEIFAGDGDRKYFDPVPTVLVIQKKRKEAVNTAFFGFQT